MSLFANLKPSQNAKGITLTSLASDMEKLNLISLYEAFHEGLKFANKDITLDETYELIDMYYEEGGEVENFFMMISLFANFKPSQNASYKLIKFKFSISEESEVKVISFAFRFIKALVVNFKT